MPAQWLSNSSEVSGRATAALSGALQGMAQPDQARRLRRGLLMLLSLWAVLGLSRLIWAMLPVAEDAGGATPKIINPVSTMQSGGVADPVDIKRMRSWHLFGEAGSLGQPSVEVQPEETISARDGIEEGARETRLNLTLRGIVASTEDGLGHAIIEHKSKQAVYAVEDKLPVSGRVTLAKVMPQQVVLDNGGTYELLVLFEDSKLGSAQTAPKRSVPVAKPAKKGEQIDKRQDAQTTALAADYRARLYKDPQSLSKVVNVSAVREDGQLLGYSIRPGQEREQFEQLGFKTGDLVTSVNGISLNNPANTMSLYSAMRSAGEVVFEVERGSEALTISVSLGGSGQQ